MKHVNITVYGQVQGVYFREMVRQTAGDYDLNGFVKNQGNGSVYIEVEGESWKIDKLIEKCRQGTEQSNVEQVTSSEGSMQNFSSFNVR